MPGSGSRQGIAVASTWLDFWNGDHRIYVSDRHKAVHAERIAADIASLVPSAQAVVLDWGCGEALGAQRVASLCRELVLCDAASAVREGLARRFAGEGRIGVVAPEDLAARHAGRVDLMVVVSVIQYLGAAELETLLATARVLLAPPGRLVIADVIPPDAGALADAASLLGTAARHGFLAAALTGLAATAASPYRRLRAELGLARHSEADMLARLGAAGFVAERLPRNIGFNQRRTAFSARMADRGAKAPAG